MLPTGYIEAVGDAVRKVGGRHLLDCIASGTVWVDIAASKVDVPISAPQKGWSGSFLLRNRSRRRASSYTDRRHHQHSFACDLKKWLQIMEAYEQGGFAYHATPPTDPWGSCGM